jgi:hypothetical protein
MQICAVIPASPQGLLGVGNFIPAMASMLGRVTASTQRHAHKTQQHAHAHQNTNRWSCWRTAAAASKMACCTHAVRAHSLSGTTQCRQLPALSAESLTAAEQHEEHDTVDAALVAGCDCEGGAAATRQGWWTTSRHRHVLLMLLPLLLLLDTLPTSSSSRICCISLLFSAAR